MQNQLEKIKEATILLAEDDAGHASLIEKNLRRGNITNPIVRVDNGQAVLDYLQTKLAGEQGRPAAPLLLLLDLNMPVMDGYEVLTHMKADEHMKHIPVIVLTTTNDPREVKRCYELGCNAYVTKPVDADDFCKAIRQLGLFLSVVSIV
ncbi:MAG: response regulator [Planctomycetaceae bacterium]|nr:MAG: response regulator [Planctomycetaceae bacterium]